MLQGNNISKQYNKHQVLQNLDIQLNTGEIMAVLGRSGCGKSTLLKILAGLEEAETGEIFWQKENLTKLLPEQRHMVYVWQEAMLFPHLNVFDNIAFGLRIRKRPKEEINKRVGELLEQIGLAGFEAKMPHTLSGGQAQRVAFARALIIRPRVLLLDEPFGKLDSETRSQMQQLFLQTIEKEKITSLFVTHDLKEALIMGQRLAYMEDGALTVYPDKKSFLADSRTGAMAEKAFWEEVE